MTVALTGVGVSLAARRVFSGASFQVLSGSVAGLIGPNGSGKTTLLKSMAGLLNYEGRICLGDQDIKALDCRSRSRLVSYVPQDETWSFAFTAEQIVAMGLLPKRAGYRESEEDLAGARLALERLDCGPLAKRNSLMLSAGERQRVLIARALIQDTPVLLMDEPTAHLDPEYTELLSRLILELSTNGRTILCSSHDFNFIASIASSVVLVNNQVVGSESMPAGLSLSRLEEAFNSQFSVIQPHETPAPPMIVQRLY